LRVWLKLAFIISKIVAAASIRILSNPFSMEVSTDRQPPLYAGQPISATLIITTSFHWGESKNHSNRRYMLRFDVEEMVKDWLVSGRKRGDFFVTVRAYC
jgi:trafficking protein particle complex subunit 10